MCVRIVKDRMTARKDRSYLLNWNLLCVRLSTENPRAVLVALIELDPSPAVPINQTVL